MSYTRLRVNMMGLGHVDTFNVWDDSWIDVWAEDERVVRIGNNELKHCIGWNVIAFQVYCQAHKFKCYIPTRPPDTSLKVPA